MTQPNGGREREERDRPDLIDWDFAVATGMRLVRPGPRATPEEAHDLVADLRRSAREAVGHVAEVTGLDGGPAGPAGPAAEGGEGTSPAGRATVAVIDRPGWVAANAGGFRSVLDPVMDVLRERRGARGSFLVESVGARATGLETGALLAFLSARVLGQYELFPPYGEDVPAGRLLLVAPNILAAEQEMGVDPRDFRMWVCVHEETHRVQFESTPWLREHLLTSIRSLLEATEVDPSTVLRRLGAAAGILGDALRGPKAEAGERPSLVEIVQGPEQKRQLDEINAVMSLLEGHADVVMDAVGPSVIPTVADIRARFQRRREEPSRFEALVRQLLGIDAKLRQYRDGARFVRAVIDRVGMSGFNAVWSSPETLPSKAEIAAPDAWLSRVHGATA